MKKSKLKPASHLLLFRLNQVYGELDKLEPDEAERKMEAVEADLDALALRDPVEATKIARASSYFLDEAIEPDEVYLGSYVFVHKSLLQALDTVEKRKEYIASINRTN